MSARISTRLTVESVVLDLDGHAEGRTVSLTLFGDKKFTVIADTLTITAFGPIDGDATRFDVCTEGVRIETGTASRVDFSSEVGRAYKHLDSAPDFIHDALTEFAFYTRPEAVR